MLSPRVCLQLCSYFFAKRQVLQLAILSMGVCFSFVSLAQAEQPPVNYTRDIKPIFSNRCYACHGPDEPQRKAELRLDERESAVADSIVPGKAEMSELLRRVTSTDPDEQMPPTASKKPVLTPKEIDLIRRWINEGAKFDTYWAYVPPTRPDVPEVNHKDWALGEIDRFVLAKLEAAEVSPAPSADKRTLARRLSFDLLGLPPKSEQVAGFIADESPEAYEKLVDQLLASPHFGERMGLFWLDQVRYADTNGIHGDNHQEHAPFRDYVIEAFNENKPFDQFTLEQLAGDLLPESGRTQLVASGYNRLNMVTREGGAQPKEYMAKYAADRVRNASSVWLGLTMACCECHNHKFDPLTIKDFYSFAAFFADVQETAVGTQPVTSVPLPEQESKLKQLDQQIAKVQETLNTSTSALVSAQADWETAELKKTGKWGVLTPTEAKSNGGAELKVDADGSILATGANPATDTYSIAVKVPMQQVTALKLEVLNHKSLPSSGPGRAANGNFVLNELELLAPDPIGDLAPVALQNATATFEQKDFTINQTIDGKSDNPKSGWAVMGEIGKPQNAVFETKETIGSAAGESKEDLTLQVILHHNYGSQHALGRFRLSVSSQKRPVKANSPDELPAEIAAILTLPAKQRDQGQQDKLAAHYRTIAPLLSKPRTELAKLQKERQSLEASLPKMLVTKRIPPREMRVLPRGNWLDDSGQVVQPAVPGFLATLETGDRRANRLDLANWLISAENPLTARVMVNRYWKLLFGRGIVPSLEDFGSQGEFPSHPELLDWLAVEFRESGWDTKHLLKLIVMSQTYRQASQPTAKQKEQDPNNQLLSRQRRFRLDAEFIRDNALTVSGLLSSKIGGESVKPYQPAGYWRHLNFPKRTYQHDSNEDQYRRGIYTYWCRTFLHPSLLAFDAPSRESCTAERTRSNTPLQALVLLNDPTYVEAARKFAEEIIKRGGESTEARMNFAMQQALSRPPSQQELPLLLSLWEKHHKQYLAESDAAKQLDQIGEAPTPADIDPAELAAWTSVARVILNLHETITRY